MAEDRMPEYLRKEEEKARERKKATAAAQARIEAGERPVIVSAWFGFGWGHGEAEVRTDGDARLRVPEEVLRSLLVGRRIAATRKRIKYVHVEELVPRTPEDARLAVERMRAAAAELRPGWHRDQLLLTVDIIERKEVE
jgi:hypothetical protein